MGNHAVIIQNQIEDAMYKAKYRKLKVRKGNQIFHYVLTHCKYNWFLNRYYPNAELVLITETINP